MPSSFATQALLDALVEEGEILRPLLQQRLEDELQQPFRQRRVVGEVGEGDLRLDHPELGEVAAGVGVLGAEGRPEGVDLAEREAVGLDVELARHGQERLAAEEILREVDLALRRARQVGEIERRDAEQRARALGVGRGDDRRVDPEEAVARRRSGGSPAPACGARASPRRSRWCAAADARPRAGTPWCAAWAGSDRCRDRRPSRSPRSALACISNGWPLAGDGTIVPVASTAQPAVSLSTSSA